MAAAAAPTPAATASASTAIAALPADVLRFIFSHIQLRARLRAVSLVCRHWRHQTLLTETALAFSHESQKCRQETGLGCLDRCASARLCASLAQSTHTITRVDRTVNTRITCG